MYSPDGLSLNSSSAKQCLCKLGKGTLFLLALVYLLGKGGHQYLLS